MRDLWKLACATTVGIVAAVAPQGDTSTPKKDPPLVTVRGCLQGIVLTTTHETGTNTVVHQAFTLTGDRSTVKQLKMLAGHLVEITGTLKGGTGDTGGRVAEKPITKGRVYVGVGSTPVTNPTQPQSSPPGPSATIDVRAYTDVALQC